MFEFVEEALDNVAFFVELGVAGSLDLAVALGWDDDLGAGSGDVLDQMICVIAFVGKCRLGLEAIDQIMGESDVVALSRAGDQADRVAQRIAGGMDLGAQPASRPTQALGIRPPFSLRAPAAC